MHVADKNSTWLIKNPIKTKTRFKNYMHTKSYFTPF